MVALLCNGQDTRVLWVVRLLQADIAAVEHSAVMWHSLHFRSGITDRGCMPVSVCRCYAPSSIDYRGMNEIHPMLFAFRSSSSLLFFCPPFFHRVLRCLFHSTALSFLPFGSVLLVNLFLTFRNHCRVFGFVSVFRPFTSPCGVLCVTNDGVGTVRHSNVQSGCQADDCAVTAFDHGSLALTRVSPLLRLIPVSGDSSPIPLRFWDAGYIQDSDPICLTAVGHSPANRMLPPILNQNSGQ
jgi:hypothetical protein